MGSVKPKILEPIDKILKVMEPHINERIKGIFSGYLTLNSFRISEI